jgi:hypothetical protein
VLFVLFSVAAALWGLVLFRQRKHSHRLHYLFMVLVAFKALTLLSEAGMYHLIRITGHPEGWNIAFYVFNFMRGILFFTVRLPPAPPFMAGLHSGAWHLAQSGRLCWSLPVRCLSRALSSN